MTQSTLFHNPRCRKSRDAKAILEENNIQFETRIYLQQPPSKEELFSLMKMLNIPLRDIVRTNEQIYKNLALDKKSDDELMDAIIENPILLERPIYIRDQKAVIGRPPERVLELLA